MPRPAQFSGADREVPEDYIFAFVNYLQGNSVPYSLWPNFAGALLAGKALSAWTARAMQAYRAQQPVTWDMLVETLLTNFAKRDRALHARRALHHVRQSGTVSSYIQHFQQLMSHCAEVPHETDLVLYFWHGLRDTVKMHSRFDPTTGRFWSALQPLMHHALQLENQLRETNPVRVQAAVTGKRPHDTSPGASRKRGGGAGGKHRSGGRSGDGGRHSGGRGGGGRGRASDGEQPEPPEQKIKRMRDHANRLERQFQRAKAASASAQPPAQ